MRGCQLRRNSPCSSVFREFLSPNGSHTIISDSELGYADDQLPMLASTSKSPVLHHLSSVAATIPAPCRAIYSATKAAAFMAVESCRVECEGSGVRFFCKSGPSIPKSDQRDGGGVADRKSFIARYDSQWIPIETRGERKWGTRRDDSTDSSFLGETPTETRSRCVSCIVETY